jgi:hypothetical protein
MDSIETRILTRWPDACGAPINPDGATKTYVSGFGNISFQPRALVGFKGANDTANGINTGASSNYSVNASSGYVAPTVTAPTLITWTSPTNIGDLTGAGGLAAAFDGVTNQALASSARKSSANPGWIGRYKSGAPKTVTRVKVYGPNNGRISGDLSSTTGTIKIYGKATGQATNSTDGVLLYSGTFNDGTSAVIDINSGITAQASESVFVRIDFGASTTFDVNVAEVEFYEGVSAANNMTLVTIAQTADATVSNARVLIEFDNTASLTAGTDFTIETTCNGGTNWTAAGTYTVVTSNSQGGRKVIETDDMTCTSGTSFAARIKTLTNKDMPIHGLALAVH